MSLQTTLLTAHKGVDLHADTAARVMRGRLDEGEALVGLRRCEMHTFWDDGVPEGVGRLLKVGRYYNPNKHHFGVFEFVSDADPWYAQTGHDLAADWPGRAADTDLESGPDLYGRLLGGAAGPGLTAVDVVSFPRGESGPVLSGVIWRLVIEGPSDAATAAETLAVARNRKAGLLLNPHMESWLLAVRPTPTQDGS